MFVWTRFIHFPPMLAAYEAKLARQRYFSRLKFAHPESTIRHEVHGTPEPPPPLRRPPLAAGSAPAQARPASPDGDRPIRRRASAAGGSQRLAERHRPGHPLRRARPDLRARIRAPRVHRAAHESPLDLARGHRGRRLRAGRRGAGPHRGRRGRSLAGRRGARGVDRRIADARDRRGVRGRGSGAEADPRGAGAAGACRARQPARRATWSRKARTRATTRREGEPL